MRIIDIANCNPCTINEDRHISLRAIVRIGHVIPRREVILHAGADAEGLAEIDVEVRVGGFVVHGEGVDGVVTVFGYAVVVIFGVAGAGVIVGDGPGCEGASFEATVINDGGGDCAACWGWSRGGARGASA